MGGYFLLPRAVLCSLPGHPCVFLRAGVGGCRPGRMAVSQVSPSVAAVLSIDPRDAHDSLTAGHGGLLHPGPDRPRGLPIDFHRCLYSLFDIRLLALLTRGAQESEKPESR